MSNNALYSTNTANVTKRDTYFSDFTTSQTGVGWDWLATFIIAPIYITCCLLASFTIVTVLSKISLLGYTILDISPYRWILVYGVFTVTIAPLFFRLFAVPYWRTVSIYRWYRVLICYLIFVYFFVVDNETIRTIHILSMISLLIFLLVARLIRHRVFRQIFITFLLSIILLNTLSDGRVLNTFLTQTYILSSRNTNIIYVFLFIAMPAGVIIYAIQALRYEFPYQFIKSQKPWREGKESLFPRYPHQRLFPDYRIYLLIRLSLTILWVLVLVAIGLSGQTLSTFLGTITFAGLPINRTLPVLQGSAGLISILILAISDSAMSRQRAYIRNLVRSVRHDRIRSKTSPTLNETTIFNSFSRQLRRILSFQNQWFWTFMLVVLGGVLIPIIQIAISIGTEKGWPDLRDSMALGIISSSVLVISFFIIWFVRNRQKYIVLPFKVDGTQAEIEQLSSSRTALQQGLATQLRDCPKSRIVR